MRNFFQNKVFTSAIKQCFHYSTGLFRLMLEYAAVDKNCQNWWRCIRNLLFFFSIDDYLPFKNFMNNSPEEQVIVFCVKHFFQTMFFHICWHSTSTLLFRLIFLQIPFVLFAIYFVWIHIFCVKKISNLFWCFLPSLNLVPCVLVEYVSNVVL